jgi:FkbM family methyltransferase
MRRVRCYVEEVLKLHSFASHTLDLDLLPEAAVVLDVGCRWFDFAREIEAVRPYAYIVAMDPARDVEDDPSSAFATPRLRYFPAALTGPGPSFRRFAHFSTGEGDFVTNLERFHDAEMYEVPCLTIKEVMEACGETHFDGVKLDCEGSEFGILENWPGPIATQISVEFHDWDKPQYRAEGYYEALWRKLPWYRVVQHELSRQGEGVGHWDTLLVLNEKR